MQIRLAGSTSFSATFFECSDTYKIEKIDNHPKQLATYNSIREICRNILDPVREEFGEVRLTYGFSSAKLVNAVKKNRYPNITPETDQHAGPELSVRGNTICDRGGIAVDFFVAGKSSLEVARWVAANTAFDRLYFYSAHRPFHVSVGPENRKPIVWMDGFRGGRHQPRMQTIDKFLGVDFGGSVFS